MFGHGARRAPSLLLALGLVLVSSTASARLRVKWDCYLPNSGVDCVTLESSLLSKIPFLESVPRREDSDVVVTLTSLPAENATRFKLDLEGKRVDGYVTGEGEGRTGVAVAMPTERRRGRAAPERVTPWLESRTQVAKPAKSRCAH